MAKSMRTELTPNAPHDTRRADKFKHGVKSVSEQFFTTLKEGFEENEPLRVHRESPDWEGIIPEPEEYFQNRELGYEDYIWSQLCRTFHRQLRTHIDEDANNPLSLPLTPRTATIDTTLRLPATYDSQTLLVYTPFENGDNIAFKPSSTPMAKVISSQNDSDNLFIEYDTAEQTFTFRGITSRKPSEPKVDYSTTANISEFISALSKPPSPAEIMRLTERSLSSQLAVDIFSVLADERPAAYIGLPNPLELGDEYLDAVEQHFGVTSVVVSGETYLFSASNPDTEYYIEALENDGLTNTDMGEMLGYPSPDIKQDAEDSEVPHKATVFHTLVYHEMLSNNLSESEAEVLGYLNYLPQPTRDGVQRAIQYGKNIETAVTGLDSKYGTDAGKQALAQLRYPAENVVALFENDE